MSYSVGFNDVITIDQVITSAKIDLGIVDTNAYDVHLEKWINEGVGRIGSRQVFIKRPAILTINNKRASLPKGFRQFLGLRFLSVDQTVNPVNSSVQVTTITPTVAANTNYSINITQIVNGGAQSITLNYTTPGAGATATSICNEWRTQFNLVANNFNITASGTSTLILSGSVSIPSTFTVNQVFPSAPSGTISIINNNYDTPVSSMSPLTRCGPILYIDQNFVDQCNCGWQYDNYWNNYIPTFEILENELVFHNEIPDGTEVQLSYMGVAIDDDCLYMIHPDYEIPLSAYARMKFLQAFPEVKAGFAGMLLAEAKKEWINQRDKVRGIASLNEFEQNRYYMIALARAWFVRQRVK